MIVFTAIFGAYDRPLRPAHASDCPHVLFTDTPTTAPGWDVRVVPRHFKNPARENRYYKLQPHQHSPGETTLYHDGNMTLTIPPERAAELLEAPDVGTRVHPRNRTTRQEFEVVRKLRLVQASLLDTQKRRYEHLGIPLDEPTCGAGIILAHPTPAAREFFDAWWAEVRDSSPRDQLSFAFARATTRAAVRLADVPMERLVRYQEHTQPRAREAT